MGIYLFEMETPFLTLDGVMQAPSEVTRNSAGSAWRTGAVSVTKVDYCG